jgi:hypothetical protein
MRQPFALVEDLTAFLVELVCDILTECMSWIFRKRERK